MIGIFPLVSCSIDPDLAAGLGHVMIDTERMGESARFDVGGDGVLVVLVGTASPTRGSHASVRVAAMELRRPYEPNELWPAHSPRARGTLRGLAEQGRPGALDAWASLYGDVWRVSPACAGAPEGGAS